MATQYEEVIRNEVNGGSREDTRIDMSTARPWAQASLPPAGDEFLAPSDRADGEKDEIAELFARDAERRAGKWKLSLDARADRKGAAPPTPDLESKQEGAEEDPVAAARQRMLDRSANAWKKGGSR
jgi:hypothetical protein